MPIVLGEYEEVAAPVAAVPVAADPDCDVEIKPNPNPMPDTKPDIKPDINLPIAMAYVPWQQWQQPYELEKGFSIGTIFPDLNLPWVGSEGGRRR